MAAVFKPLREKAVRVLQYKRHPHRNTVKSPGLGTEDFGMEAARTAPFLLSRGCYARPRPVV